MPCLNPIYIKNPQKDPEKRKLPTFSGALLVPCGKCSECRKKYGRDWRTRLIHETTFNKYRNSFFVTLTISDEHYDAIKDDPSKSIRRFLERYRKKYGKSLRHWFVTELGGKGGRLHFHGVIYNFGNFGCKDSYKSVNKELSSLWSYGNTWVGYCTAATCSYIVKYITKCQYTPDGSYYRPLVYTSAGIGKSYCLNPCVRNFHVHYDAWFITTSDGHKVSLPRYYQLKLFSEEQRYKHTLDMILNPPPLSFKNRIYTNEIDYYNALRYAYNDSVRRGTSRESMIRVNVSKINVVFDDLDPIICESKVKHEVVNPNSFWKYFESHGHYPTIIYNLYKY